jgi:hypothetical protein
MVAINDATVVASAYDTSGNGGRKLVRLSNGWLIAGVFDSANNLIRIYVSKDNGATFSLLCNLTSFATTPSFSIANKGTMVYVVTARQSDTNAYFFNFDAATVSAGSTLSSISSIDSSQSNFNGCSLAINSAGTELHAAWASKNATLPNSWNVRYVKGTISQVDGSVTWGVVEQVTTVNTAGGYDVLNPSIIISSNNIPIIFANTTNLYFNGAIVTTGGSYYSIVAFKRDSSLTTGNSSVNVAWSYKNAFLDNSGRQQSNPSAIFVPQSINGLADGRIWVAWHGTDNIDMNAYNIRVSYSDDGGSTWSAMQKLTSGNTQNMVYATITANKANGVYVLFERWSDLTGTGIMQVAMLSYINSSWSAISNLTTLASSVGASGVRPSALYDPTFGFTSPLFIYKTTTKVGFYGTWTVTTISVTPGDIGAKSDKSNLLTYSITTDGTMGTITESVNGTVVNTRNVASGAQVIVGLTQAQWDAIKYGKYKDATGGLNTLTVSMGSDTWTYTFDKRLATTDDILSAVKAVQDSQNTFLPSVKAKLGGAIRGKGGTVNDTDSWDAIKAAIDSIVVKKSATGTVISSSTTITFTTGGNSSASAYPVVVTGLSFTPRVITVFTSDGAHVTSFNNDIPTNVKIDKTATRNGSSTGLSFLLDGTNAYVTNGSFRLPTGVGSTSFTWEAIE